ncbi:MAG: nucleoside diphosphate kinase regulator [Alphaproteobacteria bacterium]|nr:MAG: nucleoside diphosphate kinase regulator [Alphaproteobacteria bacterium]
MTTTTKTRTRAQSASRPAITLGAAEAERLSALALRSEASAPLVAELLLGEIERARICPDARVPADVVRIGSRVAFVDEAHGEARTVQLVWPAEADIAQGRVSVMTPVGAGLIGLRPGQSILWPDRGGEQRLLRIEAVTGVASPSDPQ